VSKDTSAQSGYTVPFTSYVLENTGQKTYQK